MINRIRAQAGPAQLAGHLPAKLKIADSIPSQGPYLGGRFGPQLGDMWEANN